MLALQRVRIGLPLRALSLRLPISHMILHLDSPYLQTLSKEDEHAAH